MENFQFTPEQVENLNLWENSLQTEKAKNWFVEEELLSLYERMKREIPCALIRDAGKTQLEPGTITCFGAGPADEAKIRAAARRAPHQPAAWPNRIPLSSCPRPSPDARRNGLCP